MTTIDGGWRKSSFSGSQGGNCVEVAQAAPDAILVRDTKEQGRGSVHRFTASEWREFIACMRSGR
jgi:hypothetical protein